MKKYLLTIEFRYLTKPLNEDEFSLKNKKITIGIYEDFQVACDFGNKIMENLESKFQLHKFPDGRVADKERFSKNGGYVGYQKDLIVNLAYLKTPFEFYAKITTLEYTDINNVIDEIMESITNSI